MPQIYDMGPTALLPLRKEGVLRIFFALKIRQLRPRLNPRTWILKASTLPLDHRHLIMDIKIKGSKIVDERYWKIFRLKFVFVFLGRKRARYRKCLYM